jgi:hypothetical protein
MYIVAEFSKTFPGTGGQEIFFARIAEVLNWKGLRAGMNKTRHISRGPAG